MSNVAQPRPFPVSRRGWTFDQLPPNLPPGRRYVTWNLEPRGKVPYVPSCCTRRASVADPSTWDTFDEARGSVEDGKADGLGLVLAGDVVVFDLDACPRSRRRARRRGRRDPGRAADVYRTQSV